MNVDGHYSELRLFKAWKFWIRETSAQYKLCRKTFTVSTMSHMSSKKHSNADSQSSRGSSSKRRMQLTSYLWKKIGMLWKNYGKDMEFLFWGSVRTLHFLLLCIFICYSSQKHQVYLILYWNCRFVWMRVEQRKFFLILFFKFVCVFINLLFLVHKIHLGLFKALKK